jgi:glycine amidinotransferase
MARIVNSWNEWDPLKRVILGQPEGTQVPAPEPGWDHDYPDHGYPLGTYGPFPQEMVDAATEQMDNFAQILEDHGVIVDRLELHPALGAVRAFSTPDWTQLNARGINNPRDLFLVVGNEIIESPGALRSRWFEYLHLRPLFERYFKEDPEFLWRSAPRPRLTDESYEKNYFYSFRNTWADEEKDRRLREWKFLLTEKEPLWDAADALRCGRDIFWNCSAVTNRSGLDWVKRHFATRGIRVHPVQFYGDLLPWHIDYLLVALRAGLALYNQEWYPLTEEVKELFKINDWELIPAARPIHHYKDSLNILNKKIEGPQQNNMNTLSLGPNKICVEAHELRYIDQLTKLGFEVVEVPYDHVYPFGGLLHCTTLDVHRDGILEDYFPKQIPGY